MKIMIEDHLDSDTRRRLLVVEPTIYALENTRSKCAAAKFLGISVRGLRNRIIKYEELHKYHGMLPPHLRVLDPETLDAYIEKNVHLMDDKTRKLYESYSRNRYHCRIDKAHPEHNRQDISEDA